MTRVDTPDELARSPSAPPVAPSQVRATDGASGRRRISESPGADSWRDGLLRLSLSLPVDADLEQLTHEFLEGLLPLLPNLAIGACVVAMSASADPVVLTRFPLGSEVGVGRDPTRLFPGFRDERILELDDGAAGSTLHLASTSHAQSPLQVQIGTQAAQVFAAAVRRARLFARASESARSTRKLQAQIIQNEKLASLGQIVAGVVHELNNPLTSIIAYSDYLKRKASLRPPSDDREDDLERLRRIGEATARILNFSRDLVAYARPSADVPGTVRVEEILEKALVFCEHELKASRVELVRDFAPNLTPVRGMGGQLTQVFVNLFTNAAHAMHETGGQLRISVHVNPELHTLSIDVSDTGPGIHADDMPQIFEPFFTTKTEGRGTGLGLSIVRGIIDAHGGVIHASSEVGVGTVFTLTLPLAAVVPSFPPPPPSG